MRGPLVARRGRQLEDLSIIPDGAVLIENGRIRDVGPTRRVENLAAATNAVAISAEGRVVMPGFVDGHTHLVGGQARNSDVADSLLSLSEAVAHPGARSVLPVVRAVRTATVRKLEGEAREILRGCVAHGTTSLEAKSGCGLDEAAEAKIFKVLAALQHEPIDLVPTFLGAHVVPPEFESNPDGYLALLCDSMLPLIRRKELARFVDVCCDQGGFTESQAAQVLSAARRLGLAVKVHTSQHAPSPGVRLAIEHEAISVDHLDYLRAEEVKPLAESDTIATLLPACAFYRDGQRPPARALVEAGAAIALGTNYSCWDTPGYSMQMIIALARQQLRLSPAEALSAATINAAFALGIGRRVGSLEPGKDANLLIMKTSDYRDLAYSAGLNLVEKTIWHGQIVHG